MKKRILAYANVIRKKNMRGKTTGYKASLGNIEGEGSDEKTAVAQLSDQVTALAQDIRAPLVLWSLDRRTAMIGYRTEYGWSYSFHRSHPSATHYTVESGGCGPFATFEECTDRMRAHWYDNNIAPIVLGILGMGGYRAFNCTKCSAAVYSWPEDDGAYQCKNPVCGHVTKERS